MSPILLEHRLPQNVIFFAKQETRMARLMTVQHLSSRVIFNLNLSMFGV